MTDADACYASIEQHINVSYYSCLQRQARLNACADLEEIEKMLMKKASVAELQDARQTLQRQIEHFTAQSFLHDNQGNRPHDTTSDTLIRSAANLANPNNSQLSETGKVQDKVEALSRFVIQAQEKVRRLFILLRVAKPHNRCSHPRPFRLLVISV